MRSRFCLLTRTPATPWQESLEPEPTFLTVLKSKESTASQEEGEGQEQQSFPLQEGGLGECTQTKLCPDQGGGLPYSGPGCVSAQGASALTQDRSLVSSMAPPPPHQDPGERAQWGCPTSSFFPGTGALSIQGAGCGGLVMQGLLKTFQAASSNGPGASHSHTKERTEYI